MTADLPERLQALHADILAARPGLCAERALLVTEYFRDRRNAARPVVVQKAEALAQVLARKQVRIHPRELLVGCFTSRRVGGSLYPELHGVVVMEDLFRFHRRAVNPLEVDPKDRTALITRVLPFWATRVTALRGQPLGWTARYLLDQLRPVRYLVNEAGGVSHFVPDYAALVAGGTIGLRAAAAAVPANDFTRAVEVACGGLEAFAAGYQAEAERLAAAEPDPTRRAELQRISAACTRVPRHPAESLQEALQAILFAQIALNLESLDNAVSPGRLDQVLWPYYSADLAAGRLDRDRAFELLGCFALKLCEIVPVFSERLTRYHAGLFNGQVVVVGGTDREGRDATNELTLLFLELMDRLRTRQPNYHARLHRGSPPRVRERAAAALAAGAVSPALYSDEAIVPVLERRGIEEGDARDYATVGCVEPVAAGKSFLSTDAALFNVPLCLELALNRGRRFGAWRRIGAATPTAVACSSTETVFNLFRAQLAHAVGDLLVDLGRVEQAQARWHPTPLTSALLGCLQSGRDATEGGARYNGSGIQGVGVVEVGDSLAAIEHVVFRERRAELAEVIDGCRSGFQGRQALRQMLRAAPKYGNDDPRADAWVGRVMSAFADLLEAKTNTRGGRYAAGFYSVSCHEAFGAAIGALPSGRGAGEPFSSGLSPASGLARSGPTAALMSYASLPLARAGNGVNYNLTLDPWTTRGAEGPAWLRALIEGGFAAGCMQLQVNVLDPKILIEARDHPGRYPGLLVRVSGYSAYFDDLTPGMKQELIDRWTPQ